MKRLITALGLVLLFALPANAQQMNLQIANGKVTLDATNVQARQILAEWSRIGGTKVVGAEKITGAPLTLKLVDMPERQALDIILRNVAGFIAAPRTASNGASTYDRILVMATSTSPTPTQATSTNGRPGLNNAAQMNGTQRRPMPPPRPPNLPPSPSDDVVDDDQQVDNDEPQQPVFTFPSPNGAPGGVGQPVFVPMQNGQFGPQGAGGTPTPTITFQPGPNGPTIWNLAPNGAAAPAPPTTPFGAVGAPTPGMIQAPAPTPGQPTPTTRPPGQ